MATITKTPEECGYYSSTGGFQGWYTDASTRTLHVINSSAKWQYALYKATTAHNPSQVTAVSFDVTFTPISTYQDDATFVCSVYASDPRNDEPVATAQFSLIDNTDIKSTTHRFSFQGISFQANDIIGVRIQQTNRTSRSWMLTAPQISFTYTLPALGLSVSPATVYDISHSITGYTNEVKLDFTNRFDERLNGTLSYNSTVLRSFVVTASGDCIVDGGEVIEDDTPESCYIPCSGLFDISGATGNSIRVNVNINDGNGRTASGYFTLIKPQGGTISPIAPRSTSRNGNEQINFSWSYTGDGTLTKTELQWSTDNAAWSDLATINSSETTVSVAAYKFKAGTVYWRARATNSFGLTGSWCNSVSFTVTFPTLTVGLTPSELYVGSTIIADFTNRLDQQLTVRAYYNTTLLYETTTSRDSLAITCPETWFNTAGVTSNSMTVKIRAVDNLGRTSADATFTLRIPVLTVTLNKTSVVIGDTITATLSERAGRAVTLYFATYKSNQEITLAQQVVTSDDPVTVQCERSWFTDHSQLDNDKQITVRVTAATGSVQASVNFTLQYPALTADVSETSIKVGQRFTLNVTNGELERLTVTMTANSRTVATTETTSAQTTIPTDATYYARDSHSMSLTVTVTVSDKRGRTASDTFTLDANSGNMYPIVSSKQLLIVQLDSIPEEYSNTYIANVSRAKISLQIIFPSSAKAQRTVVTYDGNSMELFYNSSTNRYEATTVNPITDDTDFSITVTDQRGLTTTSTISLTGVVEYSAPSVSILNYHRCDSDHTANDSGAYCEMAVEYTISSINDTNAGTASVTSSIYTDSQTLQTYTQQVVYFFAADIEHSYDITVSLADKILTETRTVRLSTAGVIMDFLSGGKGIGLGKVAETQRMVEVNPEWRFRSANIEVKVENSMVDLGTLLAQIQQRLTNGGL